MQEHERAVVNAAVAYVALVKELPHYPEEDHAIYRVLSDAIIVYIKTEAQHAEQRTKEAKPVPTTHTKHVHTENPRILTLKAFEEKQGGLSLQPYLLLTWSDDTTRKIGFDHNDGHWKVMLAVLGLPHRGDLLHACNFAVLTQQPFACITYVTEFDDGSCYVSTKIVTEVE